MDLILNINIDKSLKTQYRMRKVYINVYVTFMRQGQIQ